MWQRRGMALALCGLLSAHATAEEPLAEFAQMAKERQSLLFCRFTPLNADKLAQVQAHIKQHPDYSSFHMLMALRRHHAEEYKTVAAETKSAILADALKQAHIFNNFGHLDSTNDLGKEWIELGTPAINSLGQILDDKRSAPHIGSEDATMSSVYSYRRCDYAYRYIMLIRGESPAFPRSVDVRDTQIEDLKKKFSAVQKDKSEAKP
jgi:hypothetical protein